MRQQLQGSENLLSQSLSVFLVLAFFAFLLLFHSEG